MVRRLSQLVIAVSAAALLFWSPPARGADTILPGLQSEYLIDIWESDNGLPQNSVISMAQTSDGYIWLSTFDGIARFDGKRFEVFDGDQVPELAEEVFSTLQADSSGNLWLRGEHSRLVVGRNGSFRRLGTADGLPAKGVVALQVAPDGTIWVGGDDNGRLYKYERGRFVLVSDTPPTPDWGPLFNLQIDASGQAWTSTRGMCARFSGGKWSLMFQELGLSIGPIKLLWDGSLSMVGGTPAQMFRYADGRLENLGVIPGGFHGYFVAGDPNGDLWTSRGAGVVRRDARGRWAELTREGGLPTETIRSELRDREGNYWFGTDGGGMVRLKRKAVQAFGTAEGMSRRVAMSLSGQGTNNVWVGALVGGMNYFDGGRFSQIVRPPWLNAGTAVWCVRTARKGGVWFGTYTDGLYFLDAGGTDVQRFDGTKNPGLIKGTIRALYEANNGDLWIGGGRGLSRYSAGQFTSWTTNTGLASQQVNAIEEDSSGAVWVGTPSGLNRILNGGIKKLTAADGLAGTPVRSIFHDSQGCLWIGGRELTRLKDGKFTAIHTASGLPLTTIKAIIEDNRGYLWLATPHGILRASLRALNEFCDTGKGHVDFAVFTKTDGLPSTETSEYQPATWKGADGRIWFATLNGVAVVDPDRIPETRIPPPVVIEAVTADDKSLPLPRAGADGAATPVLVPAGTARIEFRFSALSFTAPEKNRFRYWLEGFDPDWIQAGTVASASYTRLPPANYRFHVCGCNNLGVWNETGVTLALSVAPLFWQTASFRTLIAVVTGGLIYWFFRTRLARLEHRRRVQETFARQLIETQETERQRIARELHDGVGQSLLVAKNHLALGVRKAGPESPLVEYLEQAALDVTQAIDEVRATARALRPVELDRLGLGKAIESMLERVGAGSTTRISSELDDLGELDGREMEIQLYRIAQEAINNVLKHSHAREVIVELKRESGNLRLTVQDDGAGFDPAAAGEKGGSGLSGMAERARLIGGEFSIKSAPGKGSRLTVTVPWPNHRNE